MIQHFWKASHEELHISNNMQILFSPAAMPNVEHQSQGLRGYQEDTFKFLLNPMPSLFYF